MPNVNGTLSVDLDPILSERKPTAMRGVGTRQFHARLADRSVPHHILILGDSNSEGYGLDTKDVNRSTSWWSELQRQLRVPYDVMGPDDNASYFPAAWGSTPSVPPPLYTNAFVTGGTVTDISNDRAKTSGFGFRAVEIVGGTTNFITFTLTGTDFEIYYQSNVATVGTFKVTLDGTLLGTTCNTSRVSGAKGARAFSTGLTGLPYGPHTIKIWPNTSGDTIRIEGVKAYNNGIGLGVHVWDGSHGGFRAYDFINAPTGSQSQFMDVVTTTDTLPGGKSFDYILLALGANEAWGLGGLATPTGGRTAAQYGSDLDALIAYLVSLGHTGGFGIVFPPAPKGVSEATMVAYRTAAVAISTTRTNVDFIDLGLQFPTPTDGSSAAPLAATITGDEVHYNDRGHAWIGRLVAEAVVPRTGRVIGIGPFPSQVVAGNDGRLSWGAVKGVASTVLTLSNTQTVDGVAYAAGEMILAPVQGLVSTNGPWVVVSGGAWTRPPWFQNGLVIPAGFTIAAGLGTYAGLYTTANGGIVGKDIFYFVQVKPSFMSIAKWGID